jgi:hypothetical protein
MKMYAKSKVINAISKRGKAELKVRCVLHNALKIGRRIKEKYH